MIRKEKKITNEHKRKKKKNFENNLHYLFIVPCISVRVGQNNHNVGFYRNFTNLGNN